ncbi:MAG: DUF1343 domain-containing protein [Lentisphaeria bacterium]|nr:DUF1343 domain-containing protein [Lentisphaeria bacterium]
MPVVFPIDALISRLRGRRVGLAGTPGSRLSPDVYLDQVLLTRADPRAFLALEHGLKGELQDGVTFDSYTDPATGLPVFSFYGVHKAVPTAFFEAVDVCVFCVQDVSHRAYTFKQALAALLEQAGDHGTDIIILDRPTPLAHLGSQGPVHTQFFPLALPVVIPYTLGELGLRLIKERDLPVNADVLPVSNWRRDTRWDRLSSPWIPPSPNIPSLDSAYAYLATGLLQATNVSEGRGTCNPFEFFGAPFIAPDSLGAMARAARLPGVEWRDVYFKPGFNKYAGQVCGGLHLMITDPDVFSPVDTSLTLLQSLARLYPEQFQVTEGLCQWLDGCPRTVAEFADLPISSVSDQWRSQSRLFDHTMDKISLYN